MRPHMCGRTRGRVREGGLVSFALAILGAGWLATLATPAAAVPAFAVQAGQPCKTCHIGAFGPQLTPFGRQFKLNGYTLRAGDAFTVPLSGMAVFSHVHTQKDQPEPPTPNFDTNDNATLDEASVFL